MLRLSIMSMSRFSRTVNSRVHPCPWPAWTMFSSSFACEPQTNASQKYRYARTIRYSATHWASQCATHHVDHWHHESRGHCIQNCDTVAATDIPLGGCTVPGFRVVQDHRSCRRTHLLGAFWKPSTHPLPCATAVSHNAWHHAHCLRNHTRLTSNAGSFPKRSFISAWGG